MLQEDMKLKHQQFLDQKMTLEDQVCLQLPLLRIGATTRGPYPWVPCCIFCKRFGVFFINNTENTPPTTPGLSFNEVSTPKLIPEVRKQITKIILKRNFNKNAKSSQLAQKLLPLEKHTGLPHDPISPPAFLLDQFRVFLEISC